MPRHIKIHLEFTDAEYAAISHLRPGRGNYSLSQVAAILTRIEVQLPAGHAVQARVGPVNRVARTTSQPGAVATTTAPSTDITASLARIETLLLQSVYPELSGLPNSADVLAVLSLDAMSAPNDQGDDDEA